MKKTIKAPKLSLTKETLVSLQTKTNLRAGEKTTGPGEPSYSCSGCSRCCA